MGAFLAARRLARADDLVTPVRLVVAAAVVGALALSGAVSVGRWTRDQAGVEVPGARTIVATDLGAMGALDLTEQVDPEGEHLIATAIVRNEERLGERRAYVDAGRWDAVVGDFYDGTPARAASDAVDRLDTDAVPLQVTGDRLTVTARATTLPPPQVVTAPDGTRFDSGPTALVVRVSYIGADNVSGRVTATVRFGSEGERSEGTVRLRACAEGCLITGLEVSRDLSGVFTADPFRVVVRSIAIGDTNLVRSTWLPDPTSVAAALGDRFLPPDSVDRRLLANLPDGLEVSLLPNSSLRLLSESRNGSVPVLVADEEAPQALDLGGDDRTTDVIGVAQSMPLVGSIGLLSDIRTSAVGSDPTVPSAEVRIIAADGTPDGMLDQVAEATGTSWRSFGAVRDRLGTTHGGAQSVAYALTALACALVALLALGAGVARHLRDYRRDVASLRVLGVSVGTARRAGRAELVSLTVLVLAVVVAGGWLAVTPAARRTAAPVAAHRGDPDRHRPAPRPAGHPRRPLGRRRRARRGSGPRRARRDDAAQPAPRAGGSPVIQLFGAIVRGLRSRALLSAGSVLLTALAIGSAVLGPVFSEAVTNSYVVTRLQETAPGLTGMSRVFTPDAGSSLERGRARRRGRVRGARTRARGASPVITVAVPAVQRAARRLDLLVARRCVRDPPGRGPLPASVRGEVLMLAADARRTAPSWASRCHWRSSSPAAAVARPAAPGLDEVVVVGSYATPGERRGLADPRPADAARTSRRPSTAATRPTTRSTDHHPRDRHGHRRVDRPGRHPPRHPAPT